jgi:Ca2+:H+ antiporter
MPLPPPHRAPHSYIPPLALLVLGIAWSVPLGVAIALLGAVALVAAVLSAVHHAEVIAHRLGEPYGTLVLALAVTAIESALIVSLMLVGGPAAATLARDAVFAAMMIIVNGVVGVCLLVGGLRHREQEFRVDGAAPGLAALTALCTLALVLPAVTGSTSGSGQDAAQLWFAAACALALWAVFVFFQTVRHRDYFLPPERAADPEVHAPPPSVAAAWWSLAQLLAALVGVVGLAKALSPLVQQAVVAFGAPQLVVGVVVSMIVMLPETLAAVRAALNDRLQTSINLALGSALACIGLTIPCVVLIAQLAGLPLTLGLDAKELVLLAVSFLVASFTLGTGRTTLMQGAVHLVLFAAFLFVAFLP